MFVIVFNYLIQRVVSNVNYKREIQSKPCNDTHTPWNKGTGAASIHRRTRRLKQSEYTAEQGTEGIRIHRGDKEQNRTTYAFRKRKA